MYSISKFPILLEKAKWPRLFLLTLGWRPRKIGIYRKNPEMSRKIPKYRRKLTKISKLALRNISENWAKFLQSFSEISVKCLAEISPIFPRIPRYFPKFPSVSSLIVDEQQAFEDNHLTPARQLGKYFYRWSAAAITGRRLKP